MLLPLAAALCLLLAGRGADAGMTGEEKRIAATLSRVQGAGKTRVTLYYAEEGGAFTGGGKQATGALVVAAGARDAGVRLRLTQAVETLLGLSSGSVLVLEMEDGR